MIRSMSDEWIQRATCKAEGNTEWFFPELGDIIYHKAIELCAKCPVVAECLRSRLTEDDVGNDDGIWGGTTVRDRRGIRLAGGFDKRRARLQSENPEVDVLIGIHVEALKFAQTFESEIEHRYRGGAIREGYLKFNRDLRSMAASGLKFPPSRRARPRTR